MRICQGHPYFGPSCGVSPRRSRDVSDNRARRPRTGRHTSGTVNERFAGVLSGEVVVVSPTFFIPPTPIPGVSTIPLVDVEAPDVELVYLHGRATRTVEQLAAVARTLQGRVVSDPPDPLSEKGPDRPERR